MPTITSIRTNLVPLRLPVEVGRDGAWIVSHVDNVVTRIDTDDGAWGVGYVWLPSPRAVLDPTPTATIRVVEHAVHALEPFVLGEDLFNYERIWAKIARHQIQTGHGLMTLAHSAIDMAIWDAITRHLGQPLHRLLGGHKDEVPFYTNELLPHCAMPPEDFAEQARKLVAAGHRALKMPLSINRGEDEATDVGRIKAVREAVGPDIQMMVDVGSRISVEKVIRLGRQLVDEGLTWLEDPVPLDQVANLQRVRRELPMPIATGETGYGLKVFRQLFEAEALDIVLFEPMRVGGVTGCIKLAALAQAFDLPIAPHTYPDLAAHLMAGFPNGLIGEYLPWWARLFANPIRLENGYAQPSDSPGIGFEFDAGVVGALGAA